MLAIDLERELTVPLADLCKQIEKKYDRSVSYRALFRWCEEGVLRRRDGVRIKMDKVQGTNGYESNLAAYRRLLEALNS